jgi:hypothetical protein
MGLCYFQAFLPKEILPPTHFQILRPLHRPARQVAVLSCDSLRRTAP